MCRSNAEMRTSMELEHLRDSMKITLKPSRYRHSVGVEEVACDMAVIFGYPPEKASIAGILHDCAKDLPEEELLMQCEERRLSVSEVERKCPYLLHGKVGAAFAREKYGVTDPAILSAITYHTTGHPAMSLLEKIIFNADYIEPNRKPLPRITLLREAAYSDIDLATFLVLENMLNYLKETKAVIDTLTVDTFHYYEDMIKDRNILFV